MTQHPIPSSVALITDSTANLPVPFLEYWNIGVVPVQVIVGDRAFEETVNITSAAVAGALRSGTPVSTSRPSPARFARAYQDAAEAA